MSVGAASAGTSATRDVSPSRSRRRDPFRASGWIIAAAGIALLLYPIWRMLHQLLWGGGHFNTASFQQFTSTPGVVESLGDTALVVAVAGTLAVVIGGILAVVDERTDARMGPVTGLMPFLPFLIPGIASAIGWTLLLAPTSGYVNAILRSLLNHVGLHLTQGPLNIYSYPGLIFLYTLTLVPFAFLIISGGLRAIDSQLEEQSRVCGASNLRTLLRVMLPGIAPSLAGAFLLVIWFGFGMYSIPVTIAPSANISIVSVEIVTLLTAGYPPAYGAAITLSVIVVGIVGIAWYVQSRVLRRGRHQTTGGQARTATRLKLGAWKWPVRLLVLLYISLVTILPLAALVVVGLSGYWHDDVRWSRLSLAPLVNAVFRNPTTLQALKDSVGLGIAGATIAILLAAVVSVTVARSSRRIAQAVDGTLKLPVIVSNVILAVGFVLAFAGSPFYLGGTVTVLLITYVALFMPQATLYTDATAVQIDVSLEEASTISGASGLRTFRRVFLPLMRPGLASGWALIFVFIVGDLEVSSLLAGPSNPTIGSQTLVYFSQGAFADVAAIALTLSVISSAVVFTVMTVTRRGLRRRRLAALPSLTNDITIAAL